MRRKLRMRDEKKGQGRNDESLNDRSRRDFVALSVAAGLGATARSASGAQLQVIETNVEVKTPDGICDAAFFHPAKGSYPGVLVWPDSAGLRPAFRELGRRIAAEGYAALTPNHLYRMAKSPVFDESVDPVKNPADREKYGRITAPFFAPGAAERDAAAYVAFLDTQRQVNNRAAGIWRHRRSLFSFN